MENKVLIWGSKSNIYQTNDYPTVFIVEADNLEDAIKEASAFPIEKKDKHRVSFYRDDTRIPGDGVRKEEETQVAAFILTNESRVVGGMRGREAIYAIQKEDEGKNLWRVTCVKFIEISSEGPYVRCLLTKIENGTLYYGISGRGGAREYQILKSTFAQ